MEYTIVEVNSESVTDDIVVVIKTLCKEALAENKHEARTNMQIDNWQNISSSLLYLLLIEKRFTPGNGGLLLLMEGPKAIGVSGYYRSDFDSGIFLMGVRSWVLKKYRFNLLIAKYLLPYQLEKIKNLGAHTVAITFNDATKPFAKLIERSNKNSESKNKFFFGREYPDIYKDMTFLKEPMRIKNVKQWVLIKQISPSQFNWAQLRWQASDE